MQNFFLSALFCPHVFSYHRISMDTQIWDPNSVEWSSRKCILSQFRDSLKHFSYSQVQNRYMYGVSKKSSGYDTRVLYASITSFGNPTFCVNSIDLFHYMNIVLDFHVFYMTIHHILICLSVIFAYVSFIYYNIYIYLFIYQ